MGWSRVGRGFNCLPSTIRPSQIHGRRSLTRISQLGGRTGRETSVLKTPHQAPLGYDFVQRGRGVEHSNQDHDFALEPPLWTLGDKRRYGEGTGKHVSVSAAQNTVPRQGLGFIFSPREAVLTLSIKQACLMSADPGAFSLRKAHGLRSAEVCKFPGFSGPQGRCLEASDSGLGCRGMPVGHGA